MPRLWSLGWGRLHTLRSILYCLYRFSAFWSTTTAPVLNSVATARFQRFGGFSNIEFMVMVVKKTMFACRFHFQILLVLSLMILTSCVNRLTMHSLDGERLDGKWRFAREGSGLIQVAGSAGELLVGTFDPVPRPMFLEGYQKTFGGGTIDTDGPDVSAFGNAFAGILGNSNALGDVAYGENYNSASGKSAHVVMGPLFYWTANLQDDKRTTMQCFLIGSSYTGHGLGRCKGAAGKEYTVEF